MFPFCLTKILNHAFYMNHKFDSEVSLNYWMLWPTMRRLTTYPPNFRSPLTPLQDCYICITGLLPKQYDECWRHPLPSSITFRCRQKSNRPVIMSSKKWLKKMTKGQTISSILPKNERPDNCQYINLSQRFFWRMEDTIICFRDCLT